MLVEQGLFLEDLAARLVHFRVRLPALHERRTDIPALIRQFVVIRASTCGFPGDKPPRVRENLLAALGRAEWPYNLRQLDGVVQRLLMEAASCGSRELSLAQCVGDLAYLCGAGDERPRVTPDMVRRSMRELGSATAAARSLGVSRWTVYRYLERASESTPDIARGD
jgi:DNA-binding NtrC family response regulator